MLHAIPWRRGESDGGEEEEAQKMQCEIIPDMFGKSCRLMTPAGERSGRTDRTAAVRRVTQAFMWPCDWIFLLKPPPTQCVSPCCFLTRGGVEREREQTKAHPAMFFLFYVRVAYETRRRASLGALLGQFLQLSHEKKCEDAQLPRNKWTPHIHFRGTSFSHYIAINSAGCGLYLVRSWSRPRDMRLLTHDSSLIFVLAPRRIRP